MQQSTKSNGVGATGAIPKHKRMSAACSAAIVSQAGDLGLPFRWLGKKEVLAVSECKSNSALCAKVAAKEFPEPSRVGGRALWRSDRLAQHMLDTSATADAEREERASKTQKRARLMMAARKEKKAA